MLKPILLGYGPNEHDLYWKKRAFELLHDRPWPALKTYLFDRALIFLTAVEWSQEFDVNIYRAYSRWLSLPWPGFGWIFPLACAGLLSLGLGWRDRPRADLEGRARCLLLVAFLVVTAAFTFAGKVTGRYRMPVTLLLTPFAGAGAAGLLAPSSRRSPLAAAVLLSGLVSWPDWPQLDRRQTALHYYYIGIDALSHRDLNSAEKAFRTETARLPENADAPWELAGVLADKKQLELARAAIDEAIRREPVFWKAWNLKAEIQFESARWEEALAAADRSLEIWPQQAAPWQLKQRVYAAIDQWPKEREAFQQAIAFGAGPAVRVEFALRLEDRGLVTEGLAQLNDLAGDELEPRFDRARAAYLSGCVAAIDLHQIDKARDSWKNLAAEFSDVPFFARQGAFLSGALAEPDYLAAGQHATGFPQFNLGLAALLAKDYPKAEASLTACLARANLTAESKAPALVPEKWAWKLLRARPRSRDSSETK